MRENSSPYQYQSKQPIAAIQAVDDKGNPLGNSVEIYGRAVIASGKREIEVVDRKGNMFRVQNVVVEEKNQEKEIPGVYKRSEDMLKIRKQKYGISVEPVGFSTLAPLFEYKGKLLTMSQDGVRVDEGEEVKVVVGELYRVVGEDKGRPVVEGGLI